MIRAGRGGGGPWGVPGGGAGAVGFGLRVMWGEGGQRAEFWAAEQFGGPNAESGRLF